MEKICNPVDCTGCSACFNVCPKQAIDMIADSEGFERPIINQQKCIDCGLCVKTCPANDLRLNHLPMASYIGYAKDKDILRESSSGGIFSVLCLHWAKGKNDYRIVAATLDYNEVRHIAIDNVADLDKLRQSKYVQSHIGDVFTKIREWLHKGIPVLFVGTPCQVSGLQKYLNDRDRNNLMCIDLVCHGVPSPVAFKEYIRYREAKSHSKIENLSFTNKINGWINRYFFIRFSNGKTYKRLAITYDDPFMTCFFKHSILRPCCYTCKYTQIHRTGDITLCDAWGVEKLHPEFNYHDGCSMVLVSSERGSELFDKIKPFLNYFEDDYNKYLQYNPQLYKNISLNPNRSESIKKATNFSLSFNFYDKEVKVRPLYIQIASRIKYFLHQLKK